jgi:hypothetical protein
MLRKSKRGHNHIAPVDPNLSDSYKSAYPVTKIEDPEMIRAIRESPCMIASVERAKAFIAKHGLPEDKKHKKGK